MGEFLELVGEVRGLQPAQLTSVAARRLRGIARRALRYLRGPTSPEDLFQAFGVSTDDQLCEVAFATPTQLSCSAARREEIAAAVASLPGARERAVARAADILRGELVVFGKRLHVDNGLVDWCADPLSGHTYPMLPTEELELLAGAGDPKGAWALGRGDHWVALAQGAWTTGSPAQREAFVAAFVRGVDDFLASNPVGVGVQWACAMEVALRAMNLATAVRMLADAEAVREPAFLGRVLCALADHCFWVELHKEDVGRVPNNHLVANELGLFVVSLLFPQLPGAAARIAHSSTALAEQLDRQVHDDGWSFEGSVAYHRLSTELFTLAYVSALQCGIDLGPAFSRRLRAMYEVADSYVSERGLAPQLGDNDSGRGWPWTDRGATEQGYLPAVGAALFSQAKLKRPGQSCPDEVAWLLGRDGVAGFAELTARACATSRSSPASGLHVLRAGDAALFVSAGPNGQGGVGGHNHNDKLAFELHVRGVPLIVDPGTGTYTGNATIRNAFRSTAAHATVQVDDAEQAPLSARRLFALKDSARCTLVEFSPEGPQPSLTGKHSAFPGIEVLRRFCLDLPGQALLLTDEVQGSGAHTVATRFPLLGKQAALRQATPSELGRAQALCRGDLGASCVELRSEGRRLGLLFASRELKLALEPSLHSPSYGQVRPALRVVGMLRVQLPCVLESCVIWD